MNGIIASKYTSTWFISAPEQEEWSRCPVAGGFDFRVQLSKQKQVGIQRYNLGISFYDWNKFNWFKKYDSNVANLIDLKNMIRM